MRYMQLLLNVYFHENFKETSLSLLSLHADTNMYMCLKAWIIKLTNKTREGQISGCQEISFLHYLLLRAILVLVSFSRALPDFFSTVTPDFNATRNKKRQQTERRQEKTEMDKAEASDSRMSEFVEKILRVKARGRHWMGYQIEWSISHCLLASCCDCVSMVIISISDINPVSTNLPAWLTN